MHLAETFIQHIDGRVNHARRKPAHQEQLGLIVFLRDTSTSNYQPFGYKTTALPPELSRPLANNSESALNY